MARNALRERFARRETAYGLWVSLESPTVTEIAAALGLAWVCVDTEHGHLGFEHLINHMRAVRGSQTTVLVRVPELGQGVIKRVLDIGAHGVIVPLIRSRRDVETAMSYGRYPPAGVRSVGGERAVKWGLGTADYLAYANDEILVVPLIETREAAEEIDGILEVPGLEAIFFGPNDLSASYGFLGQWEGPGVGEAILSIRAKAAARGIAAGVLARGTEDSLRRRDQGFAMVGLGSDTGLMIRALRENLEQLDASTVPRLWF